MNRRRQSFEGEQRHRGSVSTRRGLLGGNLCVSSPEPVAHLLRGEGPTLSLPTCDHHSGRCHTCKAGQPDDLPPPHAVTLPITS
jgi:hypothetical protein